MTNEKEIEAAAYKFLQECMPLMGEVFEPEKFEEMKTSKKVRYEDLKKVLRAALEAAEAVREIQLPFDQISIDISTDESNAYLRAFADVKNMSEIVTCNGIRTALFEGRCNNKDIKS